VEFQLERQTEQIHKFKLTYPLFFSSAMSPSSMIYPTNDGQKRGGGGGIFTKIQLNGSRENGLLKESDAGR